MANPAKGDAAKRQLGTFRKDREIPAQDAEACRAPLCPEWLDESASAEWARVVGNLVDLGVQLHPVDEDALAVYCDIYARHKLNPEKTNAATLAQMRLIWDKYGMTNGSRSALNLHPKPKEVNRFLQ